MNRRLRIRLWLNNLMKTAFLLSTLFALGVLAVLLVQIVSQSVGWLDWPFLTGKLSIDPERAGILGVMVGTLGLMIVVAPVTLVLGVCTAIYLEEYAREGKSNRSFRRTFPISPACRRSSSVCSG